MKANRSYIYWSLIIFLLVAIIAARGTAIWSSHSKNQPIEIHLTAPQQTTGEIYIGGAVNNPGLYPLREGDSLEDLIRAAGGIASGADISQLELRISGAEEGEQAQKVNINQAEAWLLQALPGIGETRAQAIINYRNQNGGFHNADELLKVDGIGPTTYERIENLVTVAD